MDNTKVGGLFFEIGGDNKKLKQVVKDSEKETERLISKFDKLEKQGLIAPVKGLEKLRKEVISAGKSLLSLESQFEALEKSGKKYQETFELKAARKNVRDYTQALAKAKEQYAEISKRDTSGMSKRDLKAHKNSVDFYKGQISANTRGLEYARQQVLSIMSKGGFLEYTAEAKKLDEQIKATRDSIRAMQEQLRSAEATGSNFSRTDAGVKVLDRQFNFLKKDVDETGGAFKRAKGKIGGLGDALKKTGDKTAKARPKFNGIKKALGGLNKATNKAQFGVKRLVMAFLGFASVYAGLRKLISFAREGFGNLSQASGETKQNVQNFSASLQFLKNALGACIAPIYNTIAPALSKFIDMLAAGANAFAKFLSVLTGKSITIAKKSFAGIGDSASGVGSAMGGASEQAKELKRQLMGFDQIEKLDDIADSLGGGSGGGGGGGGGGFDDMFTTAEADDATSKWAQLIKDSWAKADFTEVGLILGTKLGEALDKIPWASIQTNAKKVGTSLGTLITGFVETPNLSNKIGATIAQALNTALAGINGFLEGTNFASVGQFITSGLWSTLTNFNWSGLGTAFSNLASSVLDFVSGAISGIDWSNVPSDIATAIKDFVSGYNYAQVFSSIGNLAGTLLKAIWDLGTALAEVVGNVGKEIKDYFAQKITDAGFDKDKSFIDNGKAIIEGIYNGIKEKVLDFGTWIYDNIWVPFRDGFKEAFGIHSPSKKMADFGGDIIDGLKQGLTGIWDSVKGIFSGLVESIGNFFKDPVGTIKVVVDKGVEKAGEIWDSIQDSTVVKTLKETGSNVIEGAKETWEKIKSGEAIKSLKETGSNIIESAKTTWESIKSGEALKTLKNAFDGKWGDNTKTYDGLKGKDVQATMKSAFAKLTDFQSHTKVMAGASNVPGTKVAMNGRTVTDTMVSKYDSVSNWKDRVRELWGQKNVYGTSLALNNRQVTGTLRLDGTITASGKAAYKAWAEYAPTSSSGYSLTKNIRVSKAKGGAFYGGGWHNIPQFAGGGAPSHGSAFIAGEKGPEVVGHVGGRSEVLNASQLASAVAYGVGQAFSKLSIRMPNPAPQLQFVTRQQQQSLEQNNANFDNLSKLLTAILVAINDKDFDLYMDRNKVTNEIVREINRRTRATGVSPILL